MKSVLITGASSGIGSATAIRFSQQGYFVHLLGRNHQRLQNTQAQLSSDDSKIWLCDVTQQEDVTRFCDEFLASEASLTSLIHNAGIFTRAPFAETTAATWQLHFHTHILGPVTMTQGLLPLIKSTPQANIVMVSSTLGAKPVGDTSAYSAMKAAMINWSQCLALELAKQDVRVNCVNPGIVNTPIHDFFHSEDERVINEMNQLHPLGRMGRAEEVADAICFLSDPSTSSWTTGSVLTIDGGIGLL